MCWQFAEWEWERKYAVFMCQMKRYNSYLVENGIDIAMVTPIEKRDFDEYLNWIINNDIESLESTTNIQLKRWNKGGTFSNSSVLEFSMAKIKFLSLILPLLSFIILVFDMVTPPQLTCHFMHTYLWHRLFVAFSVRSRQYTERSNDIKSHIHSWALQFIWFLPLFLLFEIIYFGISIWIWQNFDWVYVRIVFVPQRNETITIYQNASVYLDFFVNHFVPSQFYYTQL